MTKKDGDKLRAMSMTLKLMSNDYGFKSEEGISMYEIAIAIDELLAGKTVQIIVK